MKYTKIQERIITKATKNPIKALKDELKEIYEHKYINNFSKLNKIIDFLQNPKSNFSINLYILFKEKDLIPKLFMYIYKNTYYLNLDLVIIEVILKKMEDSIFVEKNLYEKYLKFKYLLKNHIFPFIKNNINPYFIDLENEIFFYTVNLFTIKVWNLINKNKAKKDEYYLYLMDCWESLIPIKKCWQEYFGENLIEKIYKKYFTETGYNKIIIKKGGFNKTKSQHLFKIKSTHLSKRKSKYLSKRRPKNLSKRKSKYLSKRRSKYLSIRKSKHLSKRKSKHLSKRK